MVVGSRLAVAEDAAVVVVVAVEVVVVCLFCYHVRIGCSDRHAGDVEGEEALSERSERGEDAIRID